MPRMSTDYCLLSEDRFQGKNLGKRFACRACRAPSTARKSQKAWADVAFVLFFPFASKYTFASTDIPGRSLLKFG